MSDWREEIIGFGEKGRGWVKPQGLNVYARTAMRRINGRTVGTLDLSTVEADKPGEGAFKAWFPEFETLAVELHRSVYVESIVNARFFHHMIERGYIIVRETDRSCLYKPLAQLIAHHRQPA